jgi:hypothetical protein
MYCANSCWLKVAWRPSHRDRRGALQGAGGHGQRHEIENCFQRIRIYEHVSTHYDELALTFLNIILVAVVFDWFKAFNRTAEDSLRPHYNEDCYRNTSIGISKQRS